MRYFRLKAEDVLSWGIIGGLWLFYWKRFVDASDDMFLSLFGKTVTGRAWFIQTLYFGTILVVSFLLPVLIRILSEKKSVPRKFFALLIPLLFLIPAFHFGRLAMLQVPHRDDFWEIADALQYGFPGVILHDVTTWNGRYFSWGLKSFYALFPAMPYMSTVLIVNILLMLTGCSLLAGFVLKLRVPDGKSRGELRMLAFLMGWGAVTTAVLMASNIWEVWIWTSGTAVYGVGIALCVMSVALVLRVSADPERGGWRLILPAVVCFFTCGCSELCTASLAVFLFACLVWKRVETKKWDRRLLFFFGEVMICCAGIFLFSGSLNLAAEHAHMERPSFSGFISSMGERLPKILRWAFGGLWGFTLIKYKLLLLFMGIFILIGTQLRFGKEALKKMLIIAGILFLTAHGILLINAALDYMPPRVVTIGICWLFGAIALGCLLLGSWLSGHLRLFASRPLMILAALLLVLSFGEFYHDNIEHVLAIREGWFIRDAELSSYRDSGQEVKTCYLPCMGSSSFDLTDDITSDYNTGTAKYYRIPGITADRKCPPFE